MGAAGSDVALETADVALMADDLGHLPFVVGLGRQNSSHHTAELVYQPCGGWLARSCHDPRTRHRSGRGGARRLHVGGGLQCLKIAGIPGSLIDMPYGPADAPFPDCAKHCPLMASLGRGLVNAQP